MDVDLLDTTIGDLGVHRLVAYKRNKTWETRLFVEDIIFHAEKPTLRASLEELVEKVSTWRKNHGKMDVGGI